MGAPDWAEIDQGPWAFGFGLGRSELDQGWFGLIGSAQAGSICLKIGTHSVNAGSIPSPSEAIVDNKYPLWKYVKG